MSSTLGRSPSSLSRRVHEGPADDLLAADDLDEMPLEQCIQHARSIDSAHVADLEGSDGLLVSDHRERFQRLHGQLLRAPFVEEAPHPIVQIGPRDDLEATGDLHQLEPAGPLVVGSQFRKRGLHILLRFAREELADGARRQRLGRRENQRFQNRLQLDPIHGVPPDRRSGAAHRRGAAACRRG
jgi:hypothetical protein